MTRHGVLTMSLVVLLLSACDKKAPKSQFEREYETMVERCKVVATKGEDSGHPGRSRAASGRGPSSPRGAGRTTAETRLGGSRGDHRADDNARIATRPLTVAPHTASWTVK